MRYVIFLQGKLLRYQWRKDMRENGLKQFSVQQAAGLPRGLDAS